MSASAIRQKLETIALDKLGAGFKVLSKRFDLEKNALREHDGGGVSALWGEMGPSSVGQVDQVVSVEQIFTLDITERVFVRDDDQAAVDKIDVVYNGVSEILKTAIIGKMDGLAGVQCVRLISVSDPKPFNSNQREVVTMRVTLSVYYVIA